jgi:non-specific serine/threonine protein kinase
MDFLMPGYLGSGDFFRNYIERPILEGGPAVQVGKFLNAKTRPFILRRTKAEVEKDLPPKIESTLHVEMTKSQRELYGQILEEVRPKVFDAVNKLGVKRATVSILAALLRLRQVCNHPNSIDALKELPGYDSGKFQLLKDLTLEALESGRKILLFGQFREMLSIIRGWLDEAQINHLYLDGTTRDRQSLVDKFNSDPEVKLFLISLKAGGTGLNLTAADTVIIYDPWWNPAVENQAVDRAHRIGQTKTVSVYRLVTEDSIEQKIMDLKSRKAKIVDALINENGLSTLSLSKRDLEDLFSPLPSGEGSEDTPSGE